MKVESDVLIYFHYEDTKCKFSNPLTKLRFKPQVSAAFASVSILIDADSVDPEAFEVLKGTSSNGERP